MPDNRRPFTRDPDLRLPALVVRIAPMLPVPPEAQRVGRVGAVRSSVKGIYAATIVGLESINFRHAINPERRDAEDSVAAAVLE